MSLRFIDNFGLDKYGSKLGAYYCSCGNICHTRMADVKAVRVKSCGCLQRQAARETGWKNKTHGARISYKQIPEYNVWVQIKMRCYNKNHPRYEDYGGRGIRVCKKWQKDFLAFFFDMGKRPSSQYSLDRINNDGHYQPSNCRWATEKQQANNRRKRRWAKKPKCIDMGRQWIAKKRK